MEPLQHETLANLLAELQLAPAHQTVSLQKLVAVDSRFIKDLKLNIGTVLSSQNINRKDALLLALSVAVNERHPELTEAFEGLALKEGASAAEVAETHACAAVMSANNIFYRFKHYMPGVEFYTKQPAGMRMSIMMNPVMGKEMFELMSLVVSAVNNCEQCITSHEASVKQHGASEARIYDAIRLAAVIKSLTVIV